MLRDLVGWADVLIESFTPGVMQAWGLDFESLPPERQRLLAMAIVRRETGIMAVSAGVTLFLVLRAAGTTPLI